jgi:hypothetical protein
MAKSKRSAPTRRHKSQPVTSRKRRQSRPQQPILKDFAPIHYEIDTDYGRLVCDYDISTALVTDEQGNKVAAIIKAIRDRFSKDLVTVPKRPKFASWIEAHTQKEGINNEQAEQDLRSLLVSLHTQAAWHEFSYGLGRAISDVISQHFEMSIIMAEIQHGRLEPQLGVVTDRIINLVKRQLKNRVKSPYISAGSLIYLSWNYYVCLRDWQTAKRIYRQNRNSTLWRQLIKDNYPDFPDDLVEWLGLSKGSDIGTDAFPNLSGEVRRILDYRMKSEGYWLSRPSEIALEHAARLCGCAPSSHSISRLKNIKSRYKEEAERMGVRYYLKNTEPLRLRKKNTTRLKQQD